MYECAAGSIILYSWFTKGFTYHLPTRYLHIRMVQRFFIANCHDNYDIYVELNLKENNQFQHKYEHAEMVYIKYQ